MIQAITLHDYLIDLSVVSATIAVIAAVGLLIYGFYHMFK